MERNSKSMTAIAGCVALVATVSVCLLVQKLKKESAYANVSSAAADDTLGTDATSTAVPGRVLILYGTTTGTAKSFAVKLQGKLLAAGRSADVRNLSEYDQEHLSKENIVLYICSTWEGGEMPESCEAFMVDLKDYANDFRVSKDLLEKVHFAAFGLGGELYGSNFGKATLEIDEMMRKLGANALLDVVLGDDASNLEEKFGRWCSQLLTVLTGSSQQDAGEGEQTSKRQQKKALRAQEVSQMKLLDGKGKNSAPAKKPVKAPATKSAPEKATSTSTGCCKSNSTANGKQAQSDCGCSAPSEVNPNTLGLENEPGCCSDEDEEEAEDIINNTYVTMDNVEDAVEAAAEELHRKEMAGLLDLEDMGSAVNKTAAAGNQHMQEVKDALRDGSGGVERREMVTKLQRKALTKEGYKIIGTHSAVKICRWTKNQLRGRGGCYKHSFYGITSYQCMEATPSLACANKCVFCWRHHKNPVGTEWRWKEDSPDMIVSEAVRLHQGMINEMRGVPGVQAERLQEAFTVRHCALSLVGEPIMYPRINEMLEQLHNRDISSFLVTNAQFPEHIRSLDPVTQLYVSVDASTRDSLKAIDRPLFKDFWERFLGSLEELKRKQQRTVYRMTLVKAWNMDQAEGYAELIEQGQPDFIEIKAMTYCGKSDASSLTMQNVPWHAEVCAYGDALCERLAQRGALPFRYNIATEHEHSCCILLAREDKFRPQGVWHTWIDYDKFHALMRRYYASGSTQTFTSQDYIAETPYWALYKSATRGFDPEEQRWHRNKATGAVVEIPYEASESGCG